MTDSEERENLKIALRNVGFGADKIADVLLEAAGAKSMSIRLRAAENVAKIFGAMQSAETRVNVSRTDQRMLVLGGAQSVDEERISGYLDTITDPVERRRAAELLSGPSEPIDAEAAE